MRRTIIERRLHDTTQRLVRARGELAVLDEQYVVVSDIADDTRLRALVAETPGAAREHDEASRQAAVLERTRRELQALIVELEQRQGDLLQRL